MFRSHTVEYQQDRKRTYKRNVQARSRNHCCHAKANSIILSECVSVALVMKHASLACLALPYFSTLSQKRHDCRKKNLFNVKCVF